MKSLDVLKVAKGSTIVINPYSKYGEKLISTEIDMLIEGTILNNSIGKEFKGYSEKVQLKIPDAYPQ